MAEGKEEWRKAMRCFGDEVEVDILWMKQKAGGLWDE